MGIAADDYFADKLTDPAPVVEVAEVEGEVVVTEGDDTEPAAEEPEAAPAD